MPSSHSSNVEDCIELLRINQPDIYLSISFTCMSNDIHDSIIDRISGEDGTNAIP